MTGFWVARQRHAHTLRFSTAPSGTAGAYPAANEIQPCLVISALHDTLSARCKTKYQPILYTNSVRLKTKALHACWHTALAEKASSTMVPEQAECSGRLIPHYTQRQSVPPLLNFQLLNTLIALLDSHVTAIVGNTAPDQKE